MKFIKGNITSIVVAILSVAATVICFLLFFKPKSGDEKLFNDKMELYDDLLKREQENTKYERERSNKIIDELLKQDSVKQQQVKATKQRINETPNRINNLDREPFRREFTEF